jgi:hypothetical protein
MSEPKAGKAGLRISVIASVAVALAITGWNAVVSVPVATALKGETAVTAVAYRQWLFRPDTLVFDIWRVDGAGSMADVDRVLFKAADALKAQNFGSVVLAYHGRARWRLEGAHFHEIGQEWSYQNPIYLVRTFPEHVTKMDGTPAFSEWSGGLLGVLLQELKQHNELHMRWYLLAVAGKDPDGPLPID